jgi:hypothetical protein
MAHGRNGAIASAFRSKNRSRFDNCCGRDENSGSSLELSRLAAGCNFGQRPVTPTLPYTITPRRSLRGQLVRRSFRFMLKVGLASEARSTT